MNYNTHMCPICGKHQFPSDCNYEVCPYCGWQNDSVMNDDPSYWGGANALCQLDHRLRYFYYLSKNPKYHYARDGYPDVSQIEEMNCPVCSQMRFMQLRWTKFIAVLYYLMYIVNIVVGIMTLNKWSRLI